MCGSWTEYCSPAPLLQSNNYLGVSANFTYTGPTPGNSSIVTGDVRNMR